MGTYEKSSRGKPASVRIKELQEDGHFSDPWLIKKIIIARYLHIPIDEIGKGRLSFDQIDEYYLGIMAVIDAIDFAPYKSNKAG